MKMTALRFAFAAAVLLPACGGGGGGGSAIPSPKPDFSLPDVNAASATFNTNVSPRNYLGFVSAYYFGHAT